MKIIAYGDSLTYGFPYGPGSSWVRAAGEALGTRILNRGENGDTSADLVRRYAGAVRAERPDIVIVTIGANDAYLGLDRGFVRGNLEELAEMAKRDGITLIWGLSPRILGPQEEVLEGYREEIRRLAAGSDFPPVDFSRCLEPMHYWDEVHPNEEGYRVMARVAGEALGDLLVP